MAVNKKRKEFVRQYFLCNRNATEAYLKSFSTKSRPSASVNAHKLLQEPEVVAAIEAEEERIKQKFQISRDQIVEELLGVIDSAKSDNDFIDRSNIIKATQELSKLFGYYAVEKTETQIRFDVDLGDE